MSAYIIISVQSTLSLHIWLMYPYFFTLILPITAFTVHRDVYVCLCTSKAMMLTHMITECSFKYTCKLIHETNINVILPSGLKGTKQFKSENPACKYFLQCQQGLCCKKSSSFKDTQITISLSQCCLASGFDFPATYRRSGICLSAINMFTWIL